MIHTQWINDNSGTTLNGYAIGSGVTIKGESLDFSRIEGAYNILLAITGTTTVTLETSVDGSAFFTPYNLVGTSLAPILTSNSNPTRWLTMNPADSSGAIAPYVRLSILADSNCTVTSAAFIMIEQEFYANL